MIISYRLYYNTTLYRIEKLAPVCVLSRRAVHVLGTRLSVGVYRERVDENPCQSTACVSEEIEDLHEDEYDASQYITVYLAIRLTGTFCVPLQ